MNKREERFTLIKILYKYELMDQKIDSKIIFMEEDLTKHNIKIIDWIDSKYENLKQTILRTFTKNWEWKRINPLIRAILLLGSLELLFIDKKIVINEMVEITKKYCEYEKYKFVNGVLDNVSKFYEKLKNNKEES